MTSISKELCNLDRYSRDQAEELRKRGERYHWWHLTVRPLAVFCYCFVWKRGFMAGYRGFWAAALEVCFDFWSHAKLRELELRESSAN